MARVVGRHGMPKGLAVVRPPRSAACAGGVRLLCAAPAVAKLLPFADGMAAAQWPCVGLTAAELSL